MKHKLNDPPKIGDWLIRLFIRREYCDDVLGDLYEYYNEDQHSPGLIKNVKYFLHLFSNLRPSLVKKITGSQKLNFLGMLKLNFKLSIRAILKHRFINTISLLGLVIGSICFLFIFRWIQNETSMDDFHENKEKLFITTLRTNPEADLTSISHSTLFRLDYLDFPEIEKHSQIHVYNKGEIKLEAGQREYEGKALIVDSTFLDLFSFRVIKNGKNLLQDPSGIVLTQSYAELLFGNEDAVGKIVKLTCDQEGTYQVAAILEDIPSTSSIDFDFLVPKHSQSFWRRIPQQVLLASEAFDLQVFNQKIEKLGQDYPKFPESELSVWPLADYYFNHPFPSSIFSKKGNLPNVNNMVFVAILIWLITFFGFSSLQSTLLLSNHRQHSIKRLLGSHVRNLAGEVMAGRIFHFAAAFFITLLIYNAIKTAVLSFLEIQIDENLLLDIRLLAACLFSIVFLSIVVSLFQLKRLSNSRSWLTDSGPFKIPRLQRLISTIQYSITMIMLIVTIFVYFQVTYLLEGDVGFEHENNVVKVNFFEMLSGNYTQQKRQKREADFQFIKNKLEQSPLVASFSQGDLPIGDFANATSWKRVGDGDEYTTQNQMIVDPHYDELLGIDMVIGRFFSDSLDQFREDKVVINEAAQKFWGITDISTQKLASNTSGRAERYFSIIGIVKDYHYQDFSNDIKPLVMQYRPYQDDPFLIRFVMGKEKEGLKYVEQIFQQVNPKGIFDYQLLDREIMDQYAEEQALEKIYVLLTTIAMLLSSLGMYTFSFYEAKRRTKEIGIRLVNGAQPTDIFRLMSFSLLKSLFFAVLISFPVSYFFTKTWLDNFSYRIDLHWGIFVGAAVFTTLLTQLVISGQVIKLSKTNPVDCLRYE